MNATQTTATRFPRTSPRWPSRLVGPILVVLAGVLLGQQYVQPNKRVLPLLVGVLVAGLAWRVGTVAGIGVLMIALPYPRGTVFGNTNLALILILLVFWLLRIVQRQSPLPQRSPVDVPIVGLLIMYMLSFYNVHGEPFLSHGLQNFEVFVGAVLMFYLIVNNVRSDRDLERLHQFQLVSAASVFGVAVYELNHPASTFISGWIDFSATVGTEFNTRNVRVGSMFHDYELLSEYCAVIMLTALFLFARARSLNRRVAYGLFLVLNIFVLFTTVTRGAIIALAVGMVYLLWLVRRSLRVVPFTIGAVAVIAFFLFMNYYVANFTRSGDMLDRLLRTQVVHGWMPEDRAGTWENAWGRAMAHPVIGSGPSFAELPGWQFWWPHNVYLYYANIIGFPGLLFFLWMLLKFLKLTRPSLKTFSHPDYARAYLLICRLQLVVFAVNEFKIDYLRNSIYLFPVWAMFATWAATHAIASRPPATALAPAVAAPPARRLVAVGQ